MNTVITSRAALLETAKGIVRAEGFEQLNIRRLATECKVSVGCIYTYFATKSDLVAAIIEDFWKGVFHGVDWNPSETSGFVEFFTVLYRRFYNYFEVFSTDWLQKIAQLDGKDRGICKETETFYFTHIQNGLLQVLESDASIPATRWTERFTKVRFVQFVFENMMTMLRRNDRDCSFFVGILNELLYK